MYKLILTLNVNIFVHILNDVCFMLGVNLAHVRRYEHVTSKYVNFYIAYTVVSASISTKNNKKVKTVSFLTKNVNFSEISIKVSLNFHASVSNMAKQP